MYWTQESFLDKNPLNFLIEWITSKTYRTSLGSLGTPIFRKWEGVLWHERGRGKCKYYGKRDRKRV